MQTISILLSENQAKEYSLKVSDDGGTVEAAFFHAVALKANKGDKGEPLPYRFNGRYECTKEVEVKHGASKGKVQKMHFFWVVRPVDDRPKEVLVFVWGVSSLNTHVEKNVKAGKLSQNTPVYVSYSGKKTFEGSEYHAFYLEPKV